MLACCKRPFTALNTVHAASAAGEMPSRMSGPVSHVSVRTALSGCVRALASTCSCAGVWCTACKRQPKRVRCMKRCAL
jgi:hypothetical protein